jgi:hypothetical protein
MSRPSLVESMIAPFFFFLLITPPRRYIVVYMFPYLLPRGIRTSIVLAPHAL